MALIRQLFLLTFPQIPLPSASQPASIFPDFFLDPATARYALSALAHSYPLRCFAQLTSSAMTPVGNKVPNVVVCPCHFGTCARSDNAMPEGGTGTVFWIDSRSPSDIGSQEKWGRRGCIGRSCL
ncbi:hypothetical protein BDQ17DRAFT_853259 [Cyathus striatus]|nr:hypothetical protein BDQ17DRAFT_853259 [Cyathus striatus]